MYKAVFIDMDGTLLRKDHTISEVNKSAIQKLLNNGILVVPISARPLHGILPLTQPVLPGNMPVVSLNGGYIFHNNEIIYQAHIPLPDVATIHQEAGQQEVAVMYYSQMDWFAAADNKMVKKEQKITAVKIQIQPFKQTLAGWKEKGTGPNKILIAGEPDIVLNLEQRLLQLHEGTLNIYKSQPRYLEVMTLQASKTKAIEFLIAKYGIQQNEIVAIGDNYNDKGMIVFAGAGVAMGNAPDEIKLVADFVTDTNNNDGVAKALEYFF